QSRSFCYVDDLLKGLMALMNYEGALKYEPFNLGNPRELTVRELAKLVVGLTGSSSELREGPAQQDDPARRCPVIDRAKAELGFEANMHVEQGLANTIEYFKQAPARSSAE
ncbi:MAG: SDR family NAD-dependent epimerase/dehydratase, partial [Planctomycetes bacterium]|nr:SDR family NAD-dependent epimerase/dehydratase [Planctomycetota bacterium]